MPTEIVDHTGQVRREVPDVDREPLAPAVLAEDLRSLADAVPFEAQTREVLAQAADVLDDVPDRPVDLDDLTERVFAALDSADLDVIHRETGAPKAASALARWLLTNDLVALDPTAKAVEVTNAQTREVLSRFLRSSDRTLLPTAVAAALREVLAEHDDRGPVVESEGDRPGLTDARILDVLADAWHADCLAHIAPAHPHPARAHAPQLAALLPAIRQLFAEDRATDARCEQTVPALVPGGQDSGPCLVRGPHRVHRDAAGAEWWPTDHTEAEAPDHA